MAVIEIARAGPHNNGGEVTVAQLDAMARNFDPAKPVPIFIGHPAQVGKSDAEGVKVGEVRQVFVRPETATMMAAVEVRKEVEALNKDGLYPDRSISFLPKSGILQHLALLNERPPSIKGMEKVRLCSQEDADEQNADSEPAEQPIYLSSHFPPQKPAPTPKEKPDMSEPEKPSQLSEEQIEQRSKDLQARERRLNQEEAVNFAADLVEKKIIPPALKGAVSAIVSHMPNDVPEESVLCAMDEEKNPRFSCSVNGWGEAKTLKEAVKLLLSSLPENAVMMSAALKEGEEADRPVHLAVEDAGAMIAQRAREHNLSIEEARDALVRDGKIPG